MLGGLGGRRQEKNILSSGAVHRLSELALPQRQSLGKNKPNSPSHFDWLPIRKVDDLLEREAIDFRANCLGSDSRRKKRRRNFRQTFIFSKRDGEHRQFQLRLLLSRQTMMQSIQASLKRFRRRS